jgi:membrane-bound ClpP family serine protease
MAKIDLPRHWQDWASWVLALWLLISPWALGFSLDAPATHGAVVFGAVLLALEVVTLSTFRTWEEWANVLIGICLIGAVVFLPVVGTIARADFIIVGVIVIALAFFELMDAARLTNRS